VPRVSRRAPLEGCAPVPIADVAPSKWTRQSTANENAAAAFALPTEPEPSPWWEIDLGKSFAVEEITVWIEPVDPAVRVRVIACSIAAPSGDPPSGSFVHELNAGDLLIASDGSQVVSLGDEIVVRFVRIELFSEGEPVRLGIRGIQIFGADLFADTLVGSYQRAFTLFADRPLFSARREAGQGAFEVTHYYRDVWAMACQLSVALASRLELLTSNTENKKEEPSGAERVFLGLCTKNRSEWFIAEVAAVLRGYVVVPLSPDDSEERLRAILDRCPVAAVVCESSSAGALARIAADHPKLRLLIGLGERPKEVPAGLYVAWKELLDESAPDAPPARGRSEDDLHTLLFTSGSTGVPKGAMRSYRKFNTMIATYGVAQPSIHLSFQPLCHSSERHYLPTVVIHGGHIGWSGGGAHLLSDIAAIEPTWVSSVPRLFDVVYAGYQRKLAAARGAEPERDPAEIEASVLRAHRGIFGKRVQGVSTGSAPVSPEVLAFLKRCFADIWVMDGYGSTEVGTIAADHRVLGDVQVKLVPVPGQEGADRPERGEIWVRSPHVIDGYFGDPEASAKSLDSEGFFRTGDLGERTNDGGVRVIGRLSSTVKLGQGEFVSVDRIEADLSSCPVVDQIFVHPDATSSSLLAVVVANAAAVARELGEPGLGAAEVAAHPGAARVVLSSLRAHGLEAGLATHEIPRAVLLDPEPMTGASGLLTASGKLARRAAIERYGPRLAALEATLERSPAGSSALIAASPSTPRGLADRLAVIAGAVVRRNVTPDERLSDGLGLDSLTASEVLMAIGEELGWTVPLAWWFEASNLADLARLIERRPAAGGEVDALPARDLELAVPVAPGALPPRALMDRVLLTGATGLLGAHLLEDLVQRTGAHIVCLVRAPDAAAAAERVRSTLAAYRIPALDPGRWSVIAGDLASPRLGLDDATWAALGDEIDAVVHAGASVNWINVYQKLREPNVLGTLALLELAAARRRKPFHYVSTIGTAPVDGDETTSLSFDQACSGSAYGLTKWIAEQLVRRAGEAGHPVTVHRPGMITGHSTRGFGNADDYVHRYLRACLRYGRYLDRPERLDMTPVDYVSRAIVALLLDAPGGGGAHHLCNVDQSMTYAELGRALIEAGAQCEPADYATFRAAAVQPKDSPLRPLAAYFPESGFSLGTGPWPSSATRARLATLSVRCPVIDAPLIARYLDGLRHLGQIDLEPDAG
jgi:fatty acid CoA ligase FadD9